MPKRDIFSMNSVSLRILPKITERMENAGYNDRDIMAIEALVVYEGINDNGALIERDDLERAYSTLDGKPLWIRFVNNDPTGHGFNPETGKFDDLRRAIGFIHWSWGSFNEETQRFEVKVDICVWQKYYPEICNRLRQLHGTGDLKFSYEAERDYEITPEGYRRCFNINFTGMAVVKSPALEETKSLMVAELLKEDIRMDELKKLIEGLKGTVSTEIAEQFNSHLGTLNKKVNDLEKTVSDLRVENAEKDGVIKTITVERDTYKSKVETAEKEKTGEERFTKLSKYGEPCKTKEELAEMEKMAFVDLLEKTIENFNPTDTQENSENNSDVVGGVYKNTGTQKLDRKKIVSDIIEGLTK